MQCDGEVIFIVCIDLKYLFDVVCDGCEGWVRLFFIINEVGGVEDIEVIEVEFKCVFDCEVCCVLCKWKYKFKIVDGKLVK